MNESRFSWEILVTGVLLTCAAVYMGKPASAPYAPATAEPGSAPVFAAVEQPKEVRINLRVAELANKAQNDVVIHQLKALEDLKGDHNSKEIQVRLESFTRDLQANQALSADLVQVITERVHEATKTLASLDNAKMAVVTSGDELKIIHGSALVSHVNGLVVKEGIFDAAHIRDVHLRTSGGNVQIIGGTGNEVHVRVMATGRDANIERVNERYEVIIARSGNEVTAEVRQRDQGLFRNMRGTSISMNIVVETPPAMQFNARTSGGNIHAENLDGKQYLRTSGGNVTLIDLKGNGEANTSGGNIKAHNVDGAFTLSTSGGNVTLENCSGDITAKTSGGSMNLDFLAGRLNARTSGGSVNATVHRLNGDIDLSTSGGSINLSLPTNASANLFARGGTVRLDPSFVADGQVKRNEIDALINGGGPQVACRTSGGSVNIKSL